FTSPSWWRSRRRRMCGPRCMADRRRSWRGRWRWRCVSRWSRGSAAWVGGPRVERRRRGGRNEGGPAGGPGRVFAADVLRGAGGGDLGFVAFFRMADQRASALVGGRRFRGSGDGIRRRVGDGRRKGGGGSAGAGGHGVAGRGDASGSGD